MSTAGSSGESHLESLVGQIAEEFTQACQRGEHPDVETYVTRYPQIGDLLREILPALQILSPGSRGHRALQKSQVLQRMAGSNSGTADLADQTSVAGARKSAGGEKQAHTLITTTDAETATRKRPKALNVSSPPQYDILDKLGEGGMGVVYLARQRQLDRLVALKMIRAGEHAPESELVRFQEEARAVAQLQHANIVQIFEVDQHEGMPFFSLEYVEGGSLEKELGGEPQDPERAAEQTRILALGIQVAHDHHLVHRDLKPANVLVSKDGTLKITDFGLVKNLGEESGQTQTGAIVGTPSYMAPEQAQGNSKAIGPSADVYALGAIFYECLTGRPPFRGAHLLETLEQVRSHDPVPPRQLQPGVPLDLETICLKALHKNPARRYASAKELADDLQRWENGEPILARPVGSLERTRKWMRRHPALASLMAVVFTSVILLAMLSAIALVQRNEAREGKRIADVETKKARAAEANERKQKKAAVKAGIAEKLAKLKAIAAERKARRKAEEYRRSQTTAAFRAVAQLVEREPLTALEMLNNPRFFPLDLRDFTWRYYRQQAQRLHRTFTGARAGSVMMPGQSIALFTATGRLHVQRLAGDAMPVDVSGPNHSEILQGGGGYCPSVSPNGRWLACIDRKFHLQLWDVQQGKLLRKDPLPQPLQSYALAWTPDSQKLLTPGPNGSAQLRDPVTGKTLATFPAANGEAILTGAFSADGKTAVLTTRDRQFRTFSVVLWTVDPPRQQKVLYRHTKQITALAISPNGRLLASGDQSGTIRLYQHSDTAPKVVTMTVSRKVVALRFDPRGRYLAIAGGGSVTRSRLVRPNVEVTVLDLHASQSVFTIHQPETLQDVQFTPDGQMLACIDLQRTTLWKLRRTAVRQTYRRPTNQRSLILPMSPDGSVVLIESGFRQYTLRHTDTGQLIPLQATGQTIKSALFTPDGESVVTADQKQGLFCFSTSTGRLRWKLQDRRKFGINDLLAFSPDGKTLVGRIRSSTPRGGIGYELAIWDVEKGQPWANVPKVLTSSQFPVAFSRDGKRLYVAPVPLMRTNPTHVLGWDVSGGPDAIRELPSFEAGVGTPSALVISPDGQTLVVQMERQIRIWDMKDRSVRAVLPAVFSFHSGPVFSPDSQLLAARGSDNTIVLWETKTGKRRAVLSGHSAEVQQMKFSLSGRTFVSSARDGIRLWDPLTGLERTVLKPGAPHFKGLRFGADERTLMSNDTHGVRIWSAPFPLEEGILVSNVADVKALRFEENGTLVVTGSDGIQTVRLSSGERLASQSTQSAVVQASPVSQGSLMARAMDDHSIRILDRISGAEKGRLIGHDTRILHLGFSPDGKALVSAGVDDGTLRIWDVNAKSERARLPLKLSGTERLAPAGMAISPDSTTLGICAVKQNAGKPPSIEVLLIGLADGKESRRFTLSSTSSKISLLFSPDGHRLLAWDQLSMHLIDLRNGQIRTWKPQQFETIRTVAFHPDSQQLAWGMLKLDGTTNARTGSVWTWDLKTNDLPGQLFVTASFVQSLAYSPDGNLLAVGAGEELTLWQTATRKKSITLKHPGDGSFELIALAFSEDGRWLASATKDVCLWDLARALKENE